MLKISARKLCNLSSLNHYRFFFSNQFRQLSIFRGSRKSFSNSCGWPPFRCRVVNLKHSNTLKHIKNGGSNPRRTFKESWLNMQDPYSKSCMGNHRTHNYPSVTLTSSCLPVGWNKQASKQGSKQAGKQASKQGANKQASKQASKQTSKHTSMQTSKQTNKQASKQAN